MDAGRASTTAMGAALMRAVHTRLDRPPLIDDPWGDRLIRDDERESLRARSDVADLDATLRRHPAYGIVVLRSRFAEDALAAAAGRGVRQYVIVGAGLDSLALRRPAFAAELEIFEVDHPATQRFKRDRLAECGIEPPPRRHLVAADLTKTPLDEALAGSPFRAREGAFFAWLGVSAYLTVEANLATLRAIAALAPPGSELVFDYIDRGPRDPDLDEAAVRRAREQVARRGEPWLSGFDPGRLAQDLRGVGLELVENLGRSELAARYCADRDDEFRPSAGAGLALARVPA